MAVCPKPKVQSHWTGRKAVVIPSAHPRLRAIPYWTGGKAVAIPATDGAVRSRWMTLLLMALGAGIGGYMGMVIAWLVWSIVGRFALAGDFSLGQRVGLGVFGLASAAVLYLAGLELFARMMSNLQL